MDPIHASPVSPSYTPPKNGTIMAIFALGCIGAFISGFFLSDMIRPTPSGISPPPKNTPAPNLGSGTPIAPTDIPIDAIDQLNFDVGSHYFDDTVLFMTTDLPHRVLVGSMVRIQEDTTYTHNTRVSFFDGTSWERKTKSQSTQSPAILPNDLVKEWTIRIDATRMLKEQVKGTIVVGDNTVSFSANTLANEMSVRSLPGYTKFMSEGNGHISINGTSHPAKVLYTRIYSMNTSDIQFYNEPIGVTTDWVAFWDTQGNFYHIDSSTVSKPTPIYKTHTLGIFKTVSGAISKSFSVTASRDSQTPPDAYTFSIQNPIMATLKLQRKSAINKAPNGEYAWYMGTVDGSVTTANGFPVNGYGVTEYIHD